VQERKPRPVRTLKQRAVAMLARRDYARAELAARLTAGGANRDDVERLLDELEQAGYLSDVRYASAVVHQKAGTYSRRAIAHALREKGVTGPAATSALAELEHVDELATALALWQRRFGVPPADEREKARQLRFLLSRGYSHSIAFKVLKAAGAKLDSD
jgi:regulatory protein